MEKKSYIKPSIKVSVIEAEALMAASGVINSAVKDNRTTEDDDDNQFAKENNFSPSAWD